MLIDWFTVVAQVINFLILVWLLQRFLYKPIVNAMQTREERIASQLRDAEKQKAEAEVESAKFRIAHDQLEQRKQELLREAEADAETLKNASNVSARTLRMRIKCIRYQPPMFVSAVFAAVKSELRQTATSKLFFARSVSPCA